MYTTIYTNNDSIDMVDGLSISAAYTALMLGHKIVVTIRDNSAYGHGTIGVMLQNMTFNPYEGNTFMNLIKLHTN